MKNKIAFTIIALLVMMGSLFLIPAGIAKGPATTYDSQYHFTTLIGQLGGADYEIMMPDNWNGHLIIGCKGFTPTTTNPVPTIESLNTHTTGLQFMTRSDTTTSDGKRFAYALSTYGVLGFCMQEGMIHTHQLTQYVIDNFGVTGKVFIIGFSMGGQIADMLTSKYPDLYAGVLDVCGNKDTAAFYNYWRDLSNLPEDASTIRNYLSGAPTYLPESFLNTMTPAQFTVIPGNSRNNVLPDVEAECGGTPESKPQAYERLSPTYHPQLTIPVISMIGRNDRLVPIQHFNDYYDAVQAAGCMDHYRCYKFNSIHCGPPIIAAIPTYFKMLFDWAMGGQPPAVTPKPYP